MRKFCITTVIILILLFTALTLFSCDTQTDAREVKITYVANGAVYAVTESGPSDFAFPKSPEDDFYRFEGWYLDESFTIAFNGYRDIPNDADEITLYAKLTRKTYRFRFYTDESEYITKTVSYLSDLEFPDDPDLNEYEFLGWYLNSETPISADTLATLCPKPSEYDVYARYECRHLHIGEQTVVEASCERAGERFATCKTCGEKVVLEVFPAKGHEEVIDEAVAPTCTTAGKTRGSHCSECNKVLTEQRVLGALGHECGEGIVTKPSSCTQTGERFFECTRDGCGYSYTEEIPPHFPDGWTVLTSADCVNDGERIQVCTVCHIEVKRERIPAYGHNMQAAEYDGDGHCLVCTRCGESVYGEHVMNGADGCDECPFYIPDAPATGSVIRDIAKRDPISEDFENVAGKSEGTLKITVIDIAQGDSIFIRFSDGQTMLMDGGSVNFPIGNHYDRIKSVLTENMVTRLNYLFITHSDYDHVRYLDGLLKDYEVMNVYIPKLSDDSNGSTWKDVVTAVSKEKYTAQDGRLVNAAIRYNIGDYEISGEGWRMRCHSYLSSEYPTVTGSSAYSPTAPEADKDEIINSLSPICLLEYAGRTIVLTGDSNEYNERYLVDRGVFDGVDADVLKVAHHGSKTSTTSAFLSAIKCEYAVISYGTNVFGHPTSEVINRLESFGYRRVYKTKTDGNVFIRVDGDGGLRITTEAEKGSSAASYTVEGMRLERNTETAAIFRKRKYAAAA